MSLKSVLENVNSELFFFFCRPYPLPSKSKASLMVEMIITHRENSRGKLLEKLKQAYANPKVMFDPAHFETLHTCEWVSDNIYDSLYYSIRSSQNDSPHFGTRQPITVAQIIWHIFLFTAKLNLCLIILCNDIVCIISALTNASQKSEKL